MRGKGKAGHTGHKADLVRRRLKWNISTTSLSVAVLQVLEMFSYSDKNNVNDLVNVTAQQQFS